jgi:uncharacterized RDD family membrane protein YckC
MKPRFEPDGNAALHARPEATLVDPEAYDASELQFAASLEQKPAPARFVVDEPAEDPLESLQAGDSLPHAEVAETVQPLSISVDESEMPERMTESPAQASDSWRQEVQAKITHYRARKRPRPPRYPSLQLKFESTESSWNKNPTTSQLAAASSPNQGALAAQEITVSTREAVEATSDASFVTEETGKVLEFPRVSPPVLPQRDELAEPVFDQPRILEVPEVLPPPPALGGILIEPTEEVASERRPGFELPLQAAPMSRRVLASAVDGLLVFVAVGLFGSTFFRITSNVPALRQIAVVSAALMAVFWAGYQYLLLVYAGTTPGLKLAGLRLSRFDGSPVPKNLRRWRVLASLLAGLSLALGYAWCFFDEDQLCWHDRITHTYMAPQNPK